MNQRDLTKSQYVTVEILPSLQQFLAEYGSDRYPYLDVDAFLYQIMALAVRVNIDGIGTAVQHLIDDMAYGDLLFTRHELDAASVARLRMALATVVYDYYQYFVMLASRMPMLPNPSTLEYVSSTACSLLFIINGIDAQDDVEYL